MFIIGVDYHPSDQYIAFVDPRNWGVRRTAIESPEMEKRSGFTGT